MVSRNRSTGLRTVAVAAAFVALAGRPALAQQDTAFFQAAYLTPPPEIAHIITAPQHGNISLESLSPDRRVMLRDVNTGLPTLEDYSKPYHLLGGMFIDPRGNRRRIFTVGTGIGFDLISPQDGSKVEVRAPAGAKASNPQWSPDGKSLAYLVHEPDGTHIYIADAVSGRSRKLTSTPLLATLASYNFFAGRLGFASIVQTPYHWTANSQAIITVVIPRGRGSAPTPPEQPKHPQIKVARKGTSKLRTFASLLEDQYERDLFEYYSTGQLASIEVRSGKVKTIGRPALINKIDPAPGGDYFRVTLVRKPFSDIVPVNRFGTVEEVWDRAGKVLVTLGETFPDEGDKGKESGIRPKTNLTWRPDGEGFHFLERVPNNEVPEIESAAVEKEAGSEGKPPRWDRLIQWLPPFDSTSMRVVYLHPGPLSIVNYTPDPNLLILSHISSYFALWLDKPDTTYPILDRGRAISSETPGTLMRLPDYYGARMVRLSRDGNSVYLSGTIYADDPFTEGPRTVIQRVEIRTGEESRIFESAADAHEEVVATLDDDFNHLVLSRESPTAVKDYYLVDRENETERRLTNNIDPAPELTAAEHRMIVVTRADGFKFRVWVTLPAGYQPGTRLPALLWQYPREYENQKEYDKGFDRYNKNRFRIVDPLRSMTILTQAGYAVVQPDVPIVGDKGRMNDQYIPDLRNNLSAVIDELDRQGIIDRNRLAIGGHSYGAFSTVNALVHTPFFRAGVAGSGNFNRTLTPFGFQKESRILWEARETYLELSPLLYADRMNGALLLYHGLNDQNVGTHPMNSDHLFHTLNGLGKNVALYMYPHEDHGPRTRETILDLWARWVLWLDKYVKNADRPEARPEVKTAVTGAQE